MDSGQFNADRFYHDDFAIHISALERELLFIAESLETAEKNGIDAIAEFPELKTRAKQALQDYDIRTASSRTMDICKPYAYEDNNGFRYDHNGNIVCYPKSVYIEKREDYLRYSNRLARFIYS